MATSDSHQEITGELRDSLAVIYSSVTILRRQLGNDADTFAPHLERIATHLELMCVVLARLERARPLSAGGHTGP